MAITRVQGTGKIRDNVTGTLTITFSTPPSVGNAVLILVSNRRAAGPVLPSSLTDSKGNSYPLAASRTFSTECAGIYCCGLVGTSGSPFTVTINTGGGLYAGAGVEISGVGSTGLVVDQTASATSTGTTVTAGPTAALTAAEVLLAGIFAYNTTQASITVEALSPAWVQEFEELDYISYVAGEGDTRILPSGASGTTPRAQWTVTAAGSYGAAIAAFKTSGTLAAVERVEPFLVMPV